MQYFKSTGHGQQPLEWSARQKIAVGAARGLRYLHEECRVGCIVHRDIRPNNILLTHDFEPLVSILLHLTSNSNIIPIVYLGFRRNGFANKHFWVSGWRFWTGKVAA